ncbi:helix-turn-helix domain-containing protein [Streptomyces uncialis]|uniref:helix-turn-helix domain-containing protein n=1 Tax=Streptomyces uncialis TaxID=1048205 RepID=UPI0033D82E00
MPPPSPPPDWVLVKRRKIGDRIRAVRTAARLSQERLAEYAGIDRQAVNKIEMGHSAARVDTLIRIADALDVPLRDLV